MTELLQLSRHDQFSLTLGSHAFKHKIVIRKTKFFVTYEYVSTNEKARCNEKKNTACFMLNIKVTITKLQLTTYLQITN